VEAMHGAAVTALVMYDMLKPIDKQIEISTIKLASKLGGKTSYKKNIPENFKCAVIVCSDTISKGEKEDSSGKSIIKKLQELDIETRNYQIIPDDFTQIQNTTKAIVEQGFDLLIFSGGTGLSTRDVTPDAIAPLLEKEISGIMEHARNYGQNRMPYAMLSRGIAGFIKNTLIITMPGSQKGAEETFDAIFPSVLHVFEVKKNAGH
jgi:cyclic pyranopterin phosphate synthase